MYALQVRAFVEATEVVDADPDTIEDILHGFDDDILIEEEEEIVRGTSALAENSHEVTAQNDTASPENTPDDDALNDEEFGRYLEEGKEVNS